jgi:hypothetical protein
MGNIHLLSISCPTLGISRWKVGGQRVQKRASGRGVKAVIDVIKLPLRGVDIDRE